MTNEKLIKRMLQRNIFLAFTEGEECKGFSVPQDQHHHKNLVWIGKNQEQIKAITKTEWNTAISK